jgi:hypothetical protein
VGTSVNGKIEQGVVVQVLERGAVVEGMFDRYYMPVSQAPDDELFRKYFLEGDEVQFTVSKRERRPDDKKTGMDIAVGVRLMTKREPVDLATYREVGCVAHLGDHFVKLHRCYYAPNKTTTYLHNSYWRGVEPWSSLRIGDYIEYSVHPERRTLERFNGINAVLYARANQAA